MGVGHLLGSGEGEVREEGGTAQLQQSAQIRHHISSTQIDSEEKYNVHVYTDEDENAHCTRALLALLVGCSTSLQHLKLFLNYMYMYKGRLKGLSPVHPA